MEKQHKDLSLELLEWLFSTDFKDVDNQSDTSTYKYVD